MYCEDNDCKIAEREHFKVKNFNRKHNTCIHTHHTTYSHLPCEKRNGPQKMSVPYFMETVAMLNRKEEYKIQIT